MKTSLTTHLFWCGIAAAGTLGWGGIAVGQVGENRVPKNEHAASSQDAQDFVLRTYEVGDLVINVEDRPYGDALRRTAPTNPGMGGGGGGFFSVPEEAGRTGSTRKDLDGIVSANDSAQRRFRFAQFGGGGGMGQGGGFGTAPGGEGAGAGVAGFATNITIPDLVRVIVNTIAADSWSINGGGDGRIEPLGTALVVWQSKDVQKQITDLLQALSGIAGEHRTVTIDARWLMLTSDELAELLMSDEKGVPQVKRDQLDRLTKRAGSIRGITNCMSGQLVYVVSGTLKNVVSGYVPVVGSVASPNRDIQVARAVDSAIRFVADAVPAATGGRQTGVGYQPIVQSLNFGALLEIRPMLRPGAGGNVVVDLRSTVTVQGDMKERDGAKLKEELAPAVDRVSIETLEFATTLKMPLNKPVLVGGLTYLGSATGAEKDAGMEQAGSDTASGAEKRQMYLVLEVR
jgi:hypothetical protein